MRQKQNPQIVSPHRRPTWRRAASTPRTTTTTKTTSTKCITETSTAVCYPRWRTRRRSRRSCRSCCSTRPRSSSSSAPSASLPSSSWSPSSSTPPSPPSSCSSTLGQPSVSPSTLSPGEVNYRSLQISTPPVFRRCRFRCVVACDPTLQVTSLSPSSG